MDTAFLFEGFIDVREAFIAGGGAGRAVRWLGEKCTVSFDVWLGGEEARAGKFFDTFHFSFGSLCEI